MAILVVDLDKTLIKTDLLYEAIFAFLRENPLRVFLLFWWYFFGGALALKNNLSKKVIIQFDKLPFREGILAYIKAAKANRDTIVLASASPQSWVDGVSNFLKLFEFTIGSSEVLNLKGDAKYNEVSQRFACKHFTYIGDSPSDLSIWLKCQSAVAVNVSRFVKSQLDCKVENVVYIEDRTNIFKIICKELRLHQWTKNLLLFLPMLAAHVFAISKVATVVLGFFSFSFAASAVYILNDILDVDSDRNHPTKRHRPIACGDLGIIASLFIIVSLVFFAIILSYLINYKFVLLIFFYWFLNLVYSILLKREFVLDIIALSGMYTLRLFAGGYSASVPISAWLLSLSTFFFFSLACLKRHSELMNSDTNTSKCGRGYVKTDQMPVYVLGVGSGLLSVLVFLMYLQSFDVKILYKSSSLLWFLNPLLLYWISRIWVMASRGNICEDPVLFAIKDRVSWVCALIVFVILFVASVSR